MSTEDLDYTDEELENLQNSSQDGIYIKTLIEKVKEIIKKVNE